MAKLRRAGKARTTSNRKPARGGRTAKASKKAAARRPSRSAKPARPSVSRRPAPKPPVKAVKPAPPPPAPPPPPQPPPRKPTYHEAVAMYERGLQALQRRDFAASADALRNVIERYPDERELLERARLYLKVCERELEPKEPTPKTANEWVYAATVALNAGDESTAIRHLQRALTEDNRHDHAHYMMAVVAVRRSDGPAALDHLRRAVALNPENRSLAKQDPELEALRDDAEFRAVVDTPGTDSASRSAVPQRPRVKARR